MVIERGEIWWADLPDPIASDPGFRRPVLVVQSDKFTLSRINTVVIAAVSTNLKLANADGNVLILSRQSGLPFDSVVNVSQLLSIDKRLFLEHVGNLSAKKMEQVDGGLKLILDLRYENRDLN